MEKIDAKKYIFTECYLKSDRSQPEKNFEKFLEDNGDKLEWWYKNEDNGREYFGIRYKMEGIPFTFYPDYIVRFTDGSVGIFETKSASEDSDKTKAKSPALYAYLAEESRKIGVEVWGGIVSSSDEKTIAINLNSEYVSYAKNPKQWTLLASRL